MDKLIYYYRIIHLQVGDTYIVALSLLAFALEVIYYCVSDKKRGYRTDFILRAIIWILTLSPMGYVIAKVIGHGEPNTPLAFALIPAAVCVGFAVALLWTLRPKVSTLVAAALAIVIAAGQVSGFKLSSFSTDRFGRENDVVMIEQALDSLEAGQDQSTVMIAPFSVISRISEYRNDIIMYPYEDWLAGQISVDTDSLSQWVLICPSYDAESGAIPLYENMQGIVLTDKFSGFLVVE